VPAATLTQEETIASLGRYGYGWSDSDVAGASAQRGLSEAVVRDISAKKSEPEWMLEYRLKALRIFARKPMPNWGSNLEGIHFDNIKYFVRSSEKQAATWDDLPADIKNTYDRLGIPEAEKQRRSTSRRWSTTRSARISRNWVSSSWTPTPRCVSTRRSSNSTSAP
jgi:Fe-S cluster assembly protein SufB